MRLYCTRTVLVLILSGLCSASSQDDTNYVIEFNSNTQGYLLAAVESQGSSNSYCVTIRTMVQGNRCEKLLIKISEVCNSKPYEIFKVPCTLRLEGKVYLDDKILRIGNLLYTDSPTQLNFVMADGSCVRKKYHGDQQSQTEHLREKQCSDVKQKLDQMKDQNTLLTTVVSSLSAVATSETAPDEKPHTPFKVIKNLHYIIPESARRKKPTLVKGGTPATQTKPGQSASKEKALQAALAKTKGSFDFDESRELSEHIKGKSVVSHSKSYCVKSTPLYSQEGACEKEMIRISETCNSPPYEVVKLSCSSEKDFISDNTLLVNGVIYSVTPRELVFMFKDGLCMKKTYHTKIPVHVPLNTTQCERIKQIVARDRAGGYQPGAESLDPPTPEGDKEEEDDSRQTKYDESKDHSKRDHDGQKEQEDDDEDDDEDDEDVQESSKSKQENVSQGKRVNFEQEKEDDDEEEDDDDDEEEEEEEQENVGSKYESTQRRVEVSDKYGNNQQPNNNQPNVKTTSQQTGEIPQENRRTSLRKMFHTNIFGRKQKLNDDYGVVLVYDKNTKVKQM